MKRSPLELLPRPLKRRITRTLSHLRRQEKEDYLTGRRSTEGLSLPDFLGIGAQKAGTSWLYANLRRHPEIYLPRPKELHYFDRYFYESLESYAARFAPGVGRVKGEITPNYAKMNDERIRFVRAVLPSVRLILLMRNPIDRAWSHALHRLVKATGRPFEEIPSRAFVRHFHTENSRLMGDYLATIDAWTAHFPPEQLFLGFFDQLVADPRALLTGIFHFLGVSIEVDWDRFLLGKVVHRGPGVRITPELRRVLEEIHAPQIERLYERFGDRVASWRVARPAAS